MASFIVRRLVPALGLALAGFGCAAAGPLPKHEVPLSPVDWEQVRTALAWPDLPIRSVRVLQPGNAGGLLEVEVDSEDLQREQDYRSWLRSLCSNASGAWRCRPREELVQPPGGGAVAVGPQVSAQDVLLLARFMGHAPGRAVSRELLWVRATGAALYQVGFRYRGCEHLVRLRREGEQFMLAQVGVAGVRACP
jgi:hypothetical protein